MTGTGAGSADVLLMLLADGRLPTGAHTQSGGLEPALADGLPVSDLPGYARLRLRTVVSTEAGTAVVARHLAMTDQLDRFGEVDQAWRARTTSVALRENAVLLGRGYARLVRAVWPDHPAVAALPRAATRAVVLGVTAAVTGIVPQRLAALVGYDDVQAITSAALKLDPHDPARSVALLVALAQDIDEMATQVAGLADPEDIPARVAPTVERWAQRHAVAERRLFRA